MDLKIKEEAREEAKKAKLENYKMLKKNVEESQKNYQEYQEKLRYDSELKEKISINESKIEKLVDKSRELEEKIRQKKKNIKITAVIAMLFSLIGIISLINSMIVVSIATIFIGITFSILLIWQFIKSRDNKSSYNSIIKEQSELENVTETFKTLYEKEINDKNTELNKLKEEYDLKLKLKADFEKNNDIEELSHIKRYDNIDINIEEKISNIEKEIHTLKDEKNYNDNQIELLENSLDSVIDVENELEDIAQKIDEMNEKCNILEKTKKYLETAKEQFSSHYLGNMKHNFIENIQLINGSQMDINLDVNLEVNIIEQGSGKKINYFSTGYKDLIYICMRFSLIEALFENEKPFIILDDPFVNLDERKVKNALSFLNNICSKYQIIYFICHESRM